MPCLSAKYNPNLGLIINVAIAPVGTVTPGASPVAPTAITSFTALIDTGADGTCITQAVADAVGLAPVGKIPMTSATHTTDVDAFLGDLLVPMGQQMFFVSGVQLAKFETRPNAPYQILLGRNVICQGTLTLSFDGHFTLCF